MKISGIISEIIKTVLSWEGTSLGEADFGALALLFHGKEFGHIHNYGELDIAFGKQLTEALLKTSLVQIHQFVPKTSVTFPVKVPESIPFAISLLRLSYILKRKDRNQKYADFLSEFKDDLKDIPDELLAPLRNL